MSTYTRVKDEATPIFRNFKGGGGERGGLAGSQFLESSTYDSVGLLGRNIALFGGDTRALLRRYKGSTWSYYRRT